MSTCKDCIHCIHWKACKALQHTWEKTEGTHYPLIAEKCKIFKDRSKFIEFPCKVGDYVYFIDYQNNDTIKKFYVDSIKINNNIQIVTIGGVFNDSDFGEVIFLTKEQAEQALKEREKE